MYIRANSLKLWPLFNTILPVILLVGLGLTVTVLKIHFHIRVISMLLRFPAFSFYKVKPRNKFYVWSLELFCHFNDMYDSDPFISIILYGRGVAHSALFKSSTRGVLILFISLTHQPSLLSNLAM